MGQAIGSYELGEILGEVVIGSLLAATRTGDGEPLAVALARPELAGDHRFASPLRMEVARLRGASTVGTVPLLDVVERDGAIGVVMGRPAGARLDQWRALNTDAAAADCVRIVRGVADAIGDAHRRGIVHGALAPDQVWIADDGGVTVLGAGLLAAVEQVGGDTTFSRTDWLGFISPAGVTASRATAQDDGYALGVLAWWLLTGSEPFGADATPPPPYAQVELDPPSLASARPDLAAAVGTVLERQLSRDPSRRAMTVHAFADDLERASSS